MEREQTDPWLATAADAVRRAQWEGAYIPGDDPFVENSRFPERVMIERPSSLNLGVSSVQVRQVKP